MPLLPGSLLGPYEIVSPLGSGAMGDVYVAKDPRLGREVAIKVLPPHHARDPELLNRFEREVKVVAALSHPNILVIHDFGTTGDGVCFAVMELLEGETLRSLINQGPLPWSRALEIALAVAEGLSAAHSKGVVHRDLKPENIFLTSLGTVKILDFGLAKVDPLLPKTGGSDLQTILQETLPGTILGTINYMSPEQMRGNTVDLRSDIFSFGCVLYEMLAGKKPFVRSTPADTMAAILREAPADMESGVFLPAEIKHVIDGCLEKDPERRIATALDLVNALRRVANSSTILDARLLNPSAARRRKKKAIDSLAILPFTNASGDADAEYLSDGITEGIINSLSQLQSLRVMALSTVLRYKGRESDPIAVGQQLGVRAVITGRVFLRGENMSVQTELVDVIDGAQLWGERYTRKLCDIFDMPEEIAKEISDKLRLKLVQEEKRRLTKRHTENPAAFQLYLKGRFHWNKRTQEGFYKAMEYFEEAIREDPQYALAYSGLSDCYSLLAGFGYMDPKQGYQRAKEFAQNALQIDETLSEAYSSMAIIRYRYDWDWSGAEKDFRRAIELNPGYPYARHWFAVYLVMVGRFEDAVVELDRSLELDPLSLVMNWTKGYLLYYMRHYNESVDQLRRTLELEPNFVRAHFDLGIAYIQKEMYEEAIAEFRKWIATSERNPGTESLLGYAYAASGRRNEALEMIEHLKAQSASRYVSNYSIAMIYVALRDKDQAFEWLQKSFERREDALISLKINPRLDSLRDDPRFQKLLEGVGLA